MHLLIDFKSLFVVKLGEGGGGGRGGGGGGGGGAGGHLWGISDFLVKMNPT